MMDRTPTTLYLWISRVAGFAGIVCIIMALVTAIVDTTVVARPTTLVQVTIAAFLFSIWAVLYEIRDRGIRTK